MNGLSHTPAEILAQALIDLEEATDPTNEDEWPVYAPKMPPNPDELIAVADTTGTLDGRYMDDGEYVEHPGFQIRVRVTVENETRGWKKANSVMQALATVARRLTVTVDDVDYQIQSVTFTSPVVPMGQDRETQRRHNFSLNGRLTLKVL